MQEVRRKPSVVSKMTNLQNELTRKEMFAVIWFAKAQTTEPLNVHKWCVAVSDARLRGVQQLNLVEVAVIIQHFRLWHRWNSAGSQLCVTEAYNVLRDSVWILRINVSVLTNFALDGCPNDCPMGSSTVHSSLVVFSPFQKYCHITLAGLMGCF